jgi:carbon monoxide dehydrogenase subunit G
VKIGGSHQLAMPAERAYDLLQDPAVLAKCMPGCEALERIAENEYVMRMKMTLASISGKFEGKVRITEPNSPHSFRLMVEGTGKIGFVKGEGLIALAPSDTGSTVTYDGEVQVGGLIANVGQRLIETTAKMMIKRFFDTLAMQPPASQRIAAD